MSDSVSLGMAGRRVEMMGMELGKGAKLGEMSASDNTEVITGLDEEQDKKEEEEWTFDEKRGFQEGYLGGINLERINVSRCGINPRGWTHTHTKHTKRTKHTHTFFIIDAST